MLIRILHRVSYKQKKGEIIIFEQELTDKKRYYEAVISKTKKSLEDAPVEGRLRVMKGKKRTQYFKCIESGDTKGEYITKENIEIAKKLAQRDYDKKIMKCAQEWVEWIDKVLKSKPDNDLISIYRQSEKRLELLKLYEISDEDYVKNWESLDYEPNPYPFPEIELYTDKGERVRSKSEIIIANTLNSMNIPYKYEKPIQLGNSIVYPDFTILHVKERKEKLLEHFGMMDNAEYETLTFRKIVEYEKSGYWPGENLLFTIESSKYPLDTRILKTMLRKFLY